MPTAPRAPQDWLDYSRWLQVAKNAHGNCARAAERSAGAFRAVSLRLIDKLGFGARFRLLRSFSVSSAAVMALITAAVVAVYQSNQAATLLRIAEDQNVTLARSFANTVWARHAHYLSSLGYLPGAVIRAWPETADLDRQLRQITKGLPVLKIKIFNLDGLTIYSSEWAQIGESRSTNQGFLKALGTATPASKMSFRGTFSAFSGVQANVDLAETYVPIVDETGKVVSVFELYTDITPHVARMRTDSWFAAAPVGNRLLHRLPVPASRGASRRRHDQGATAKGAVILQRQARDGQCQGRRCVEEHFPGSVHVRCGRAPARRQRPLRPDVRPRPRAG